jgi:hypothetical protein
VSALSTRAVVQVPILEEVSRMKQGVDLACKVSSEWMHVPDGRELVLYEQVVFHVGVRIYGLVPGGTLLSADNLQLRLEAGVEHACELIPIFINTNCAEKTKPRVIGGTVRIFGIE